MSGSYIASVTSGGCTVTGNVNITVNQTPTVAITGPSALCYGGSGTLIANSGGTYVWSTGATTAAINITPITTTTYTVTTTNLNGCTATASSVVTVNQMPAPIISPASATICTGDNVTLNVSGGTNYLWSNGSTGIALTVSPTTTTTYNIMASNGGCTATNTVTVTVNQTPTASISPASATICNGENALLLANGGGTYQWNNGAATNLIVVAPATTTTYTVIVTNLNGCTATASSMVTVNPAPTASITGNLNTCPGANTTLTAIGGNTYVWSTGSNAQIITVNPNTTTTYTVTVSNTNGCKSSTSVQVNVYPSPTATITPSSLTICQGTNGVLTATGGVSYLWSTGQPTATITVSPPATTNYNVIVTDGNGCKASAITTVIVNHISSYFSYAAEVSCPGGNNGYANIAVNGQYPYAYWWSPTPTSGQGTSSVNNLTAGVWNVQITDANGCVTNNSITILQPPQIVITPSINNQTVTVSVSGGTLLGSNQYQYLWSPTPVAGYGASTATFAEGVTHVQLTVTDGHECQETAMMTLSGGVGINEMTTESPINIYPNPVSDVLYIETGNIEVSEIQIFDVQGKMITLSGSTTTVDMAKMPTGIYLLRIITKDGDMFSSKVMKE
ncbi:MAG: T9SS type A sorting domain-containing protein [Candidatus Absconditabacterales bacterium]